MTFKFFLSIVGALTTIGWIGYKTIDRLGAVESKASVTEVTVQQHTQTITQMKQELIDFHREWREMAGLPPKAPQ